MNLAIPWSPHMVRGRRIRKPRLRAARCLAALRVHTAGGSARGTDKMRYSSTSPSASCGGSSKNGELQTLRLDRPPSASL